MVRVWAAVVLVAVVVLAGCGSADVRPGPPDGSAAGTDSGSGEGLIDVEGGLTHQEQLAELETVVEVMREYFGEDVATIEGEPWTAELHDANVAPRPRGDGAYRHRVGFNVAPQDLEEAYAAAEEIAEELGLSENKGNSQGITGYGEIFYGAGQAEGRGFLMTGESAENFRAAYNTRLSDDPSLEEALDRVVEKNRREREEEFGTDPLGWRILMIRSMMTPLTST